MAVADLLIRARWRWRAVLMALVGLVLAVATGVLVEGAVADAERARAAYGATRTVLVATRALGAGTVLADGDVVARRWPVGLVPEGALEGTAPPPGRTLAADVVAGEVLVAARLAPGGLSVVAAKVPEGRRAVAVPVGGGLPPLEVGDVVDLVAAAGSLDPGAPAVLVAEGAVVVAVGEEGATVAVRQHELPATALALVDQLVVVALRGA